MEQLIEQDEFLRQLPDSIKGKLNHIGQGNENYKVWFASNIDKIRNKLRTLNDIEEIQDIVAELVFAAHLYHSGRLTLLEYEPLGTVHRAPDFKAVLYNGQEVYLEVRRIRRNTAEIKRDEFFNFFSQRIKAIHMNFGVSIYCHELNEEGLAEEQIYTRLINQIEQIAACIEQELYRLHEDLDEVVVLDLDEYAGGLQINVHKIPSDRRDNRVHYYGGINNCPMNDKEYHKFGDIIREKLPQLVAGEQNVILVLTDNDSHMFEDLEDAIVSINQLIGEQDDVFFNEYGGGEGFLRESVKLGGVLVFGRSREGKLWVNTAAIPRLSQETIEFLRQCNS